MLIIVPGQEAKYGYLFDFALHEGILRVLIRIASYEVILLSTHNIPFSI